MTTDVRPARRRRGDRRRRSGTGLARDEVRLLAVRPDGDHAPRASATCPSCSSPATWSSSTPPRRCPPGCPRAGPTASPCRCTCRPRWTTASWVVEVRRPDNDGPDLGVEPGTVLVAARRRDGCTLLGGFPDPAPAVAAVARPHRAARDDDGRTCPRTASRSATATCTATFPLAAYQNVYADRARQRRDGQRRPAVHRRPAGAADGPRRSPSPRSCCTPASPAPSCTSRRTPSGSRSRRSTARLVTGTRRAGASGRRRRHHGHPGAGVGHRRRRRHAAGRRLDRPRARPRPARPASVTGLITGLHAPEASHLQLLEAVAGAGPGRGGLPAAPSPSTTSGTSSATRCSSSPDRSHEPAGGALQQDLRARRADGAGRTCTAASPGSSTTQAARRPAGEPRAARRRRSAAPAAARRSRPPGARPAPSPRGTSPSARPSASSWLASESVAIAHSGRSRIRPASATAPMTAASDVPQLGRPRRRPPPLDDRRDRQAAGQERDRECRPAAPTAGRR